LTHLDLPATGSTSSFAVFWACSMPVTRALLSVSDKQGVVSFARELAALGVEILSTGGTAELLSKEGVTVRKVSDYTGAPEILDGRVKTLHPRIHGGILARRDRPDDLAELAKQSIGLIDLVVVNLYPFAETVARNASEAEVVENIDIGGPSLLRAAAKNAAFVGAVVDPADYQPILEELRRDKELSNQTRRRLMAKAFAHTAAYDAAIAAHLASGEPGFPDLLVKSFVRVSDLRYGENPHQKAAFYREPIQPGEPSIAFAKVLAGKELSYNNLLDLESALACAKEFDDAAAVIVKHNTPCGVAVAGTIEEAYVAARACDEVSAYGGVVALNRPVDPATAARFAETFLEAVVAPQFSAGALTALSSKKNLRLLEAPRLGEPRSQWKRRGRELRALLGGALYQERDLAELRLDEIKVVTQRSPTEDELRSAFFAWKVVKHVKSNGIVFANGSQTVGIGGGQTNRVDSVKGAAERARSRKSGPPLQGSAVASDAFFPFRDGLDEAARAGAKCAIQPGGSVRDAEVISAANEHGMAMVFTGRRHFRH
jgi:phosphoribosylaminoimidazolecarboxamide formyltransferase / IMP cyclohydrolase